MSINYLEQQDFKGTLDYILEKGWDRQDMAVKLAKVFTLNDMRQRHEIGTVEMLTALDDIEERD